MRSTGCFRNTMTLSPLCKNIVTTFTRMPVTHSLVVSLLRYESFSYRRVIEHGKNSGCRG